jgi:hypothetical protein
VELVELQHLMALLLLSLVRKEELVDKVEFNITLQELMVALAAMQQQRLA